MKRDAVQTAMDIGRMATGIKPKPSDAAPAPKNAKDAPAPKRTQE